MQVNHGRVVEQGDAGHLAKALSNQEITVAMHEKHFNSRGRKVFKTADNLLVKSVINIIFACPVFIYITQNLKRVYF
jgi:hypothetical protein